MKIYTSLLFAVLLSVIPLRSQTVLSPGDIAFVSINSSGDSDNFAFVLLRSVTAGTNISFTDCGWNEASGFTAFPGDSHFVWTASSSLSEGTVVTITTNNGNTLPQANTGNTSGSNMLISIAGDQLFAYQGTVDTPSFIAGINFNQNSTSQPGDDFDGASVSNSTTALPAKLTIGVNAIQIYDVSTFAEEVNSIYGGIILDGTKLSLMDAVNDIDNWNTNDNVSFLSGAYPYAFTLAFSTDIGNESNASLKIYPNPVTDAFKVEGIDNPAQITLFSESGKTIFMKTISDGESVPVQALVRGIYILRVETESKKISYHKLIVQ